MNIDNIEIVKKLINENQSFSFILKTKKYEEIYNDILDYTKDLNIKFIERIYWYINQLKEYPTCSLNNCNNKSTKFLCMSKGYKKYCSARCAARSDECKQKHIETCRKKYGVNNVAQCNAIQHKMQQTSIKRYGVPNIGAYAPNRIRIKSTNLKKYGTKNGHKKEDFAKIGQNISNVKCRNFYNNVLLTDDEIIPMFSLDEYMTHKKNSENKEFLWHCNKCGNDFIGKFKGGKHIARCLNCYPYSESKPELDLIDFIIDACPNLSIKQHDRSILKPLEVDVYVPEKNLAIEFDGLYWHSDDVLTSKNYHLYKTEECEKKGIQLIHVFENEWINKQDIVKSRIKNLLGIYDKTVFARNCEVKEVDGKISYSFQEENHIQGAVNSKVNLGLYFQNELISLMTFSKPRFDKKHEWELVRFCNKLGYHIPGGASKLLKYFERTYKPKNIVSYADRRWSQGKLYNALGFKLDHISKPDYWYFNFDLKLQSRIKYQKHKLKNMLQKFDENKTEIENMKMNKFRRIFDCGNFVFVKMYNI